MISCGCIREYLIHLEYLNYTHPMTLEFYFGSNWGNCLAHVFTHTVNMVMREYVNIHLHSHPHSFLIYWYLSDCMPAASLVIAPHPPLSVRTAHPWLRVILAGREAEGCLTLWNLICLLWNPPKFPPVLWWQNCECFKAVLATPTDQLSVWSPLPTLALSSCVHLPDDMTRTFLKRPIF